MPLLRDRAGVFRCTHAEMPTGVPKVVVRRRKAGYGQGRGGLPRRQEWNSLLK